MIVRGRRRRLEFALLVGSVGLALLGRARIAHADEGRTSSLSWVRLEGTEDCIGTRDLASRVEARLRRDVFVSPARADVSVEGTIERTADPPGYRAHFRMRDAQGGELGVRTIERGGEDCRALDESLTLVVSVMIDPDAATRPETEDPKKDPGAKPARARERVITKEKVVYVDNPPATGAQPKPPPFLAEASASGLVALGPLPNPAIGGGIETMIEPSGFIGLEGGLRFFPPRGVDLPDGASADFAMLAARGGLCPHLVNDGVLWLGVCARSEVGVISARPEAFAAGEGDSAYRVYVAGGVGGLASVRLVGPFVLRGSVTGMLPVMQSSYVATGRDGSEVEIFSPWPVALTASLGLGIRLPPP